MTRLLPERPQGSSRVTLEQLQGVSRAPFLVAVGLLQGIARPCGGTARAAARVPESWATSVRKEV